MDGASRLDLVLVHPIEDLTEAFARTSTHVDRDEVMEPLRASADLYTTLADPLLRDEGIELESDARSTVGAALEAGLHWRPGG